MLNILDVILQIKLYFSNYFVPSTKQFIILIAVIFSLDAQQSEYTLFSVIVLKFEK